jgi:hypothetical protein
VLGSTKKEDFTFVFLIISIPRVARTLTDKYNYKPNSKELRECCCRKILKRKRMNALGC